MPVLKNILHQAIESKDQKKLLESGTDEIHDFQDAWFWLSARFVFNWRFKKSYPENEEQVNLIQIRKKPVGHKLNSF